MQESTYFSADQLVQGGLTAELLHALKARLNGVMGQIVEMRQRSFRLGHVLNKFSTDVSNDAGQAKAEDRPQRARMFEDLQLNIRLINCQTAAIESLAKLAEMISERLQAPLRQVRAGSVEPAARPRLDAGAAGVIVAFEPARVQVAAARQATVAISEAFEMLAEVEAQATTLADAQDLAMAALHARLAALSMAS